MRQGYLAAALALVPVSLPAQLIEVKTVPVASGDQFLVVPSERLGMGGVSIALDDALLDPFVNPAKGVRVDGSRLFGNPTFYGISGNNGSARTIPFGGHYVGSAVFGGAAVAMQQLLAPDQPTVFRWNRQPTRQAQRENWFEWSPSWGSR